MGATPLKRHVPYPAGGRAEGFKRERGFKSPFPLGKPMYGIKIRKDGQPNPNEMACTYSSTSWELAGSILGVREFSPLPQVMLQPELGLLGSPLAICLYIAGRNPSGRM